MPKPIRDLIEKYSHEPLSVRIEQKSMTVPTVEQLYYEVDRRNKMELLTRLIDLYDIKLGIIFCNTKRMVDDLVDHLEAAGYQADRLHGDMSQNMRDRVMNRFRQSGLEFLVATDVAARGIDVDDVEVVFNYDLPYDPEDYVHRIGRTGRAGKSGRAISLVPYRELFQIRNIERFANVRIQRGKVPTEDEVAEARESVFLDKLRALLTSGGFPSQERLLERLAEEGFSTADVVSALIHQLHNGEGVRHTANAEEHEHPQRAERMDYAGDRGERGPRRDERGGRFEDRRERAPREPRRARPEERRERPAPRAVAPRTVAPRAVVARAVAPAAAAPVAVAPTAAPARSEAAAPGVIAAKTTEIKEKKPISTPPSADAIKPAVAVETKPAAEKTYSDAEILASVKSPETKPESKVSVKPKPGAAGAKTKPSRATPAGQTRLWMNLGETQGVKPIDIVNAIAGETGLPGKVVGLVDIREKHLFVDVADEHVNGIVAKLNRAQINGQKVKAKVA
jgi:ATP-dependent RNA helicase DeaD